MSLSFSELGAAQAENSKEELDVLIKPFTTKAPIHIVESLDLIANYMQISRNALVLKLIDQYLGKAFIEFHEGFSGDKALEDDGFGNMFSITNTITDLIESTSMNLSPTTESFLRNLIEKAKN
ncbi:hypothetical protein G9F31_15025 [Acinetobacter sp. 187]|uniref:hypothetical protein n=1 Tax=Acinetobacter lanii TaxID=2715163 RepID=UPI00140BF4EF|nr:hypothetical protein [Acinetobacter lanii]NHC05049.1 hypothetical protein [Acinetobacter lanii]